MTVARLKEFLRFCLVGGGSAAASMGSMYVLTDLCGLHYRVGFVLTFLGINLISFLMSGTYVFQAQDTAGRAAMVRYYTLNAITAAFNLAALSFLVDVLGVWYMFALVFISAVNTPVNYFMHRRLTFRVGQVPPSPPTRAPNHESWPATNPADPS